MDNTAYNLILVEDYDELSKKCAGIMLDCVIEKPNAVICLATGYSPLGVYRFLLVRQIKGELIL